MQFMRRYLVLRSTSIRSIGYDSGKKILELEFQNLHVYQFFEVPFRLVKRFIAAQSMGRFFNQSIKAKFKCEQIA